MKKKEVVREIANQTGIERNVVEDVLEDFMATVKKHVVNMEYISLSGFGRFGVKKRAAKTGRIISRNIPVKVPAHFIPSFKPSKKFIEEVKATVCENWAGTKESKQSIAKTCYVSKSQ